MKERTPPKKHLRMDVRVKMDGTNIIDINDEKFDEALNRVARLLSDKFGEEVQILLNGSSVMDVLKKKIL